MAEKEKMKKIGDILLNNAMYIIIALAVVYITIMRPKFLGLSSIVNVLSLTAAKLPMYRTDRHRYFGRPCGWLNRLYLGVPADNDF